jgi:hypothetical protein
MNYVIPAILAVLLNNISGYFVKKRDASNKTYDIGQNILPNIKKFNKNNIFNDGLVLIAVIIAALNRSKLDEKFFKTAAYMYTARAITSSVTTFQNDRDPGTAEGLFNYANDYIFSGHVTASILVSYFTGTLWPTLPILASLTTIATREHYTVDVVLAWLIFYALKCIKI